MLFAAPELLFVRNSENEPDHINKLFRPLTSTIDVWGMGCLIYFIFTSDDISPNHNFGICGFLHDLEALSSILVSTRLPQHVPPIFIWLANVDMCPERCVKFLDQDKLDEFWKDKMEAVDLMDVDKADEGKRTLAKVMEMAFVVDPKVRMSASDILAVLPMPE